MTRLLPCMLVVVGCLAATKGLRAAEVDLSGASQSNPATAWRYFSEAPDSQLAEVWTFGANGQIACQGMPRGYIFTVEHYKDFVLELDWRWPPGTTPGKGGVLFRMTGENKIWPKSLEAQINAGGAGDFWGLDGFRLQGPADRMTSLDHEQFGRLTNLKRTTDAEKPAGQWNHYKIVAQGPTVTLYINGKQVNRATGCDTTPGPIVLTAEGTPYEFRNVRLKPVGE